MGEYDALWQNRESRYPGAQLLPADRSVHVTVDPEYAATYAGQVAVITAASLFSRMTKSVAVQVPSLPVAPLLPWSSRTLDEIVMWMLNAAHPLRSLRATSCDVRRYLLVHWTQWKRSSRSWVGLGCVLRVRAVPVGAI